MHVNGVAVVYSEFFADSFVPVSLSIPDTFLLNKKFVCKISGQKVALILNKI